MPYLIDGHNLIPRIPGLSLSAIDDEIALIQLLGQFCRLQRKQVEVFFDNAPPGLAEQRSYGAVTASFVRRGSSADQAILSRLKALGKAAANWTVVSSDHAVQEAARRARAQALSSEAFAASLAETLNQAERPPKKGFDPPLDAGEVQEWLDLFRGSDKK